MSQWYVYTNNNCSFDFNRKPSEVWCSSQFYSVSFVHKTYISTDETQMNDKIYHHSTSNDSEPTEILMNQP